jgi:hypothetical protein
MQNAASLILRTRTGLNDLNGGSPSKKGYQLSAFPNWVATAERPLKLTAKS